MTAQARKVEITDFKVARCPYCYSIKAKAGSGELQLFIRGEREGETFVPKANLILNGKKEEMNCRVITARH